MKKRVPDKESSWRVRGDVIKKKGAKRGNVIQHLYLTCVSDTHLADSDEYLAVHMADQIEHLTILHTYTSEISISSSSFRDLLDRRGRQW